MRRYAKIHPAFLALFLASLLVLVIAFFVGVSSVNACGNSDPDPDCTLQAETGVEMASVFALIGLTLMVGGVGFQIGRSGGQQQFPAPPQAGYPVGAPPFPQQPPGR
jgi:hypothetical protein